MKNGGANRLKHVKGDSRLKDRDLPVAVLRRNNNKLHFQKVVHQQA